MTTARTFPSISIVILAWNQSDLTLECLDSLAGLDYPADQIEIVVVDNGSVDDTCQVIPVRYPTVTLLQTGENLGYAEGNNIGVRYALQRKADYVFIINNDVALAPDCLLALVDEAEQDSAIGIVGPKMYFAEPTDMVFAAGSMIDWRAGDLVQRGLLQRENESGLLYVLSEDVDFIIGCGVLLRRQMIEQIGMLDARYYLNFEDVDWCVRARKAGYRVRYTPRALLWHKVSASLGRASPRNTYYMTRNSLLFFGTHLKGWARWRALGRIVIRNLGYVAVWTFKRKYRSSARSKRGANILALRDALLGRWGKMGADVEAVCRRK